MTDPAYRIKALEWEHDIDIYSQIAHTTFGVFRIYVNTTTAIYRARFDYGGISEWIGGKHKSFSEAEAACTEHWENMIKQALEEA